jgi:Flp pilus assembly pilin Flp
MTNPDLDDMVVEGTSTRDEAETESLRKLWSQEEGRDIAEYAVMLAVILVLVVGTIRLIGGSANNVFSATASSIGG